MLAHDLISRLAEHGKNVQPQQHGPEPIFLADVVGACSRTLLPAERNQPGIQEVAEELPACGRLVGFDPEPLRDPVHSPACGHGAGHPRETCPITRRNMGVGG